MRSTASIPWTPRFRHFCTLYWLYIVLVTKKVDRKPTIYHIGLASFTTSKYCKYTGLSVLTSYLLSICFILEVYSSKQLWGPFWIKTKHIIVKTNVRSNHQQLNRKPSHLERHFSVLVTFLTDYLQYWWQTRLMENWRFSAEVQPPSQWKINQQAYVILVLPSYFSWNIK